MTDLEPAHRKWISLGAESTRARTEPLSARLLRYVPIALTIVGGVVVSTTIFFTLRDVEALRIESDFSRRAVERTHTVAKTMEAFVRDLRATGALFDASEFVSRSEFRRFVTPLLKRQPGIRALEWIPRVPRGAALHFEKTAREHGFDLRIRAMSEPDSGARVAGEYLYPVFYVEPYETNEVALGLDLGSDTNRREAIERARDTAQPAAARPLALVQDTEGVHSALVFLPNYDRRPVPADVAGRREALVGFVLAVFRLPDLLAEALSSLDTVGISVAIVHDGVVVAEQPRSATDEGPSYADTAAELHRIETITMGGHEWEVHCMPTASFRAARSNPLPLAALLVGLFVTLLLSIHLYVVTRRAELQRELELSEERLRMVLDAVTDPIVTLDADGRIDSANPVTGELFGYPVSELVGQPMKILMPESQRSAHMAGFNRYVESRERHIAWEGVDIPGRHKSGKEIPLNISIRELSSGGTRVFIGILHDISERKRVEEALRDDVSELTQTNVSFSRVLQAELIEKETREKLAKITAKVESGLILEEVLEQMFEAFQTVIPYDRMGCALIEDDEQTARSIWTRSNLPRVEIPVGYSARLEGSSLRAVIEGDRPRILNDLEAYLREHPGSENTRLIVAEGMRSSLTCPLIAMGKPVGFLFFSSTRPHAYDDRHVEIYAKIAEHLSLIVEKGKLYHQLVETKREVELRNVLISEVFGRYTSDAIVSELLESPEALKMGGETRKVTVLFADLCGFTSLCAGLDPQRVVRLLNIHLGVMTDVIMSHGGTIDEFLGDAVLVIFGAPIFAEDDAQRALACAIAMQRAMEGVNRQLSDEGLPTLQMGIAVHTGEVVAGNIGSERRAKYGIVGSAVNLVTRIEQFTSGGQILCSEETLWEVGDLVDFGERVEIPGKGGTESVQAVSVRQLRDQP